MYSVGDYKINDSLIVKPYNGGNDNGNGDDNGDDAVRFKEDTRIMIYIHAYVRIN